jgi:hypothetical protein
MGYKHRNCFSEEHRKKISEALKRRGIVPPSRKGVYKNGKPFDRNDYMKKYNAEYYKRDPEWQKERSRIYYGKMDKEKRREYQRKYSARKNSEDIHYRLMCLFRKRIGIAIKNAYGKKAHKTIELIGCPIGVCRKHLEKQFTNGMSWKNYGLYGWHIDHIIPLHEFDLTKPDEQKKAFYYKNLQPLFCKDNLVKNKRLDWKKI